MFGSAAVTCTSKSLSTCTRRVRSLSLREGSIHFSASTISLSSIDYHCHAQIGHLIACRGMDLRTTGHSNFNHAEGTRGRARPRQQARIFWTNQIRMCPWMSNYRRDCRIGRPAMRGVPTQHHRTCRSWLAGIEASNLTEREWGRGGTESITTNFDIFFWYMAWRTWQPIRITV